MAADILIHQADNVPVGKDQEPHLELARIFASRFNRLYNIDYFKEPQAYNFDENLVRLPGLDGSTKMGKSEGNAIYLNDRPEIIRKKIMQAKTDAGPTIENQPKSQEIINLFTLMKYVSSPDTFDYFEQAYNNCSIRYGEMKKQLAEDIIHFCEPVRLRINDLSDNTAYLEKVMRNGAEKARSNGGKTIAEVREIIGFRKHVNK
jgi:tryptophanyl-tRNA synthetase